MTEHSPITPPPELVRHWSRFQGDTHPEALWFRIANEAAQWGADQELEACCKWLESEPDPGHVDLLRSCATALRDARRPKPSSLKKQALEALDDVSKMSETLYSSYDPPEEIYSDQVDIIRRALEALPDG